MDTLWKGRAACDVVAILAACSQKVKLFSPCITFFRDPSTAAPQRVTLRGTRLLFRWPSAKGSFTREFKIERKIAKFRALNQHKLISKPAFWAKPPRGEGALERSRSTPPNPPPSGRGRGEGQGEAWRALAGPLPPDADSNTVIEADSQVHPS